MRLVVPGHLNQHLAVPSRICRLPGYTKRVVDFVHRGDMGSPLWIHYARPVYSAAERGHPDMIDAARTFHIAKHDGAAGRNHPVILIAAILIPAGHTGGADIPDLSQIPE
ncbi:hypothetical protein D3C75_871850 [compost metagenome]